MLQKLTLALVLLVSMPIVQAGQTIPWKYYLAGIGTISLVVAIILSLRNEKADSRAAKILLGGLYFWVLTFAQLIVFAGWYHFFS